VGVGTIGCFNSSRSGRRATIMKHDKKKKKKKGGRRGGKRK
jgi:hypothetical protein